MAAVRSKNQVRVTAHFTGRVQGVGFRYTAQNIALQHDVTGFVKNLPDGRVELVMEGPEEEANSVLHELADRMGDFIRGRQSEKSTATGEFCRFCIRH